MQLGQAMREADIKKGLQELNSGIHFDMGGKLNLPHPKQNICQGIFHNGRHLCSMDREAGGAAIPEFAMWAQRRGWDKEAKKIVWVKDYLIRIGWRETFLVLARKKIRGITPESLAMKFKYDIKYFHGDIPEIMNNHKAHQSQIIGASW